MIQFKFVFITLLIHILAISVVHTQVLEKKVCWYSYNFTNGQDVLTCHSQQKDAYAFICKDGDVYQGRINTAVVEATARYNKSYLRRPDKVVNFIFFRSGAAALQRENEIRFIQSHSSFKASFPLLTNEPAAPYEPRNWSATDDILILSFEDPYITDEEVEAFAARHNLMVYYKPPDGLPPGNWSYNFLVNDGNAVTAAKAIFESDSQMVFMVNPNIFLLTGDPFQESLDYEYHLFPEDGISIYPTITDNFLFVELSGKPGQMPNALILFDAMGKKVLDRSNLPEGKTVISTEGFASGVYYYHFQNRENILQGKVVLLK